MALSYTIALVQLGGGSYSKVVGWSGRKVGHASQPQFIPELDPNSLMASDPSVFTAMVSRLGGLSVAPEELDWALDTPAGARIMDFFLSKCQLENKSLGDVA